VLEGVANDVNDDDVTNTSGKASKELLRGHDPEF